MTSQVLRQHGRAAQHVAEDGLIVNRGDGVDDKWSAATALNLTYCVSTTSAPNHAGIVSAMAGGTALWESASSKVNFVYVPARTATADTATTTWCSRCEPVNTNQYIARAFFPSTDQEPRNILVD